MPARRHIAVAGAGIAGLTTGLALAQAGFEVTILEQAPRLDEVGAGLQVSPNAWRVLEAVGVARDLESVSVEPRAIRMRRGGDGRTIARVPLGAAALDRWGAPYRVVHRADIQSVLVRAIAAAPNAELRLGARAEGFRRDGARVCVTTGTRQQDFDGLIGADGLWSATRLQITGEAEPVYSGKVAWRATIPATALAGEIDPFETGLWLGRDAHLVHYAVRGGGEVNIVAIFANQWTEPGWSAAGDRREVMARFGEWSRSARDIVAAPQAWLKWALADRPPLPRWGSGPVTLAGDAAHPMLPFLAQGAAMGMEDGLVLARSLEATDDVASAFRLYENRRMRRTARVQRDARTNGEIYHLGGIAAAGRDAALGLLGPERLMARFDWLYGWGRQD